MAKTQVISKAEKDRIIDFLAKNAFTGYEKFTAPDHSNYWQPVFTAYAKLVVESFNNANGWERNRIKKILDGTGVFLEPALTEAFDTFGPSHEVIKASSDRGHSLPLLDLLMIEHDVEYILRPGLLRLYWAAANSKNYQEKYIDVMLYDQNRNGKKKKNTRLMGFATRKLIGWLNQNSPGLLTKNEHNRLEKFVESLIETKKRPISPDSIRNWIAHRDFIIDLKAKTLTVNINNGLKKRKVYQLHQVETLRDTILRACVIVLFLNFIFLWCASIFLHRVSFSTLAQNYSLGYIPP